MVRFLQITTLAVMGATITRYIYSRLDVSMT